MKRCYLLLLNFMVIFAYGQDKLSVQRCADIDRNAPIINIFIDDNNNKWVADQEGIFLAQSPDFASPVEPASGKLSVMSWADGNYEYELDTDKLKQILGDDYESITAVHYYAKESTLWVGTEFSGLYILNLEPEISLKSKVHSGNSKLRSNKILNLSHTPLGQMLVGTDDGLLIINGKKETLIGKFFNIEAIGYYKNKIWVLSSDEIFEVDEKQQLFPLELKPQLTDGTIVDIAFDSEGNLWIASEIVSRYNVETEEHLIFGPAQEFTSQNVNCIAVDQDDALWVGTRDKGVYYIGTYLSMSGSIVVAQPLSCNPEARDAILEVRASGGQPPYTYQWSNGLSGPNPTNVGPGKYDLTITDQSGKTVLSSTEIKDKRLTIDITLVRPAGIGTEDGQAKVTVSGGNPAYSYKWDNGETRSTATRLGPGQHGVTITDKSGCQASTVIKMTEAQAPLAVTIENTRPLKCESEATGILEAAASGGKPPYKFSWENNTNGKSLENIGAGTYSVTVTDNAGNEVIESFELTSPNTFSISIKVLQPASTNSSNGIAEVVLDGGEPPFQYQWDNNETQIKATKLAVGTRSVTVTDINGCQVVGQVNILENILPLALDITENNAVECFGGNTGKITAKVSGGKGPFQFKWNVPNQTGQSLSNLKSGNYTVTVEDATGSSISGTLELGEPQPLSASIRVEAVASTNQSDGIAIAQVEGGVGPFKYFWDNGEKTEKAERLAAGSHTLNVSDANGCSTNATVEISEDILPLQLSLVTDQAIQCAGQNQGGITAQVTGGKAPFTYNWTGTNSTSGILKNLGPGTYEVTITDVTGQTMSSSTTLETPQPLVAEIVPNAPANTNQADGKAMVRANGGTAPLAFQWDNGETTAEAVKLAAGSHRVTVTDANGCQVENQIEITEDILPLEVTLEVTKPLNCAGERDASLSVVVSGGKSPFRYKWNNVAMRGDNASRLSAGVYEVTVTDAANTTKATKITIESPPRLELSLTQDSPASTNNSDGIATASIKGGVSPYSYEWDNGATTAKAENLAPGNHNVKVSDKNGCSTSAKIKITEDIQPLIVKLEQTESIKCQGTNTGALNATYQGGKPPYKSKWNRTDVKGDTPTNLGPGSYEITVFDASGLSEKAEITISAPPPLTVTLEKGRPATNEDSKDGKASLTITGGSSEGNSYTYAWDNGETASEAEKLTFGTHSVTITDANGCTATTTFETEKKILPALTANRLKQGATLQVSRLYFEADSVDMTEASYPTLDEIAGFLEDNPLVVIEIGGHTNNIPEHDYCDQLSTARAKAVALYLVDKGIDPTRLVARGYGKRAPKYSNKTEDGRRRNQRVELKILRLN